MEVDEGHEDDTEPAREGIGLGRSVLAFAFVGSACLLVLEIVAGRLVAPRLGVSLYTWTSVIGVVLAGVSLGNYLGGRLADRWPSRSTLGLVYLAGSASSLLVLGVLHYLDSLDLPDSTPALIQVIWVITILFFLPSTILGIPTPLLTRLSLFSVEQTGRVVGRIQAAATLGSIFGTFLTGFFLISWVGTRHVVVGVAAALLVLAILARPPWLRSRVYEIGSLAVVILVAGWASDSACLRESNYYCIRLDPGEIITTVNGKQVAVTPDVQSLYLDHLLHSEVDTVSPLRLLYGYETEYAGVLDRLYRPGSSIDSFSIGGGGYAFARYLEARYKGQIDVAEIDQEVTAVAREHLGLKPSARMRLVEGDARQELRTLPASRRYDAIFGDAFSDLSVPYHLTTREFHELVALHLRPGGVYLLNVVDGEKLEFLRSEIRTLRLTFPYVALVTPEDGWPPKPGRSTYVVVAANAPPKVLLPTLAAGTLEAFLAGGYSVVLTDDYAPVEQLLAPVFRDRLRT
ncbi:MAG: fused MFS/spermidine synthase [Thermoleophilia bacterium]